MSARFQDKVIVITGAAGGIGKAAVERFGADGARIAAVDLDKGALQSALAASPIASSDAIAIEADVTRSQDVEHFFAEAERTFGGIDFIFNNAGIEGAVAPIDQYPEDVFDRVLAVNVKGVFLGIKHGVPALRRRGGGVIVNTASVAGIIGDPSISAYIASKHAVLGLTKSAAIGFGPHGIRVNAVCPAPIETRMMRSLEAGLGGDDPEAVKAAMNARIPLGRYGEPEEVAALVAFLCSDDARYINGSAITVDGGMTTQL